MTRIPERTDIGFSLYAKRTVSRGWLAALLLLMIISRGDAASAGGWAATRFEAGLRLGTFSLDEDSEITRDAEGNVCGGYTCGISIDTLDVDQRYIPLPFVRVFFNDYIGLQVSWEGAKVAALADAQWEELETHKDGDVMIAGPSLQAIGRYPCGPQDRIVPMVGAGIALLDASFNETEEWGGDGVRQIDADDTYGLGLSVSCAFRITEQLQVDASWEYLMVDVDMTYYFGGEERASWSFPLDGFYIEMGVAYTF